MKRFLEYLVEERRKERERERTRKLLEGELIAPYKYEIPDLTDGRKYVVMRRDEFEDSIRYRVGVRFYGPCLLKDYNDKFAAIKKAITLPPPQGGEAEISDTDTYKFGVIDAGDYITCPRPNGRYPGGAAVIGFYDSNKRFKRAFVFQISFNECVSLALMSGAKTVNPMMLFKVLNSVQGVFEDEKQPVIRPVPDDYDRQAVVKFVQNPKSHFNDSRHTARSATYMQPIIDAQGELGEVIIIDMAKGGATTQWDNLLTDKNWVISIDTVTGRIRDLLKLGVRKLIQYYIYGRKTSKEMQVYGKWIPRERLFTACDDESHGLIV